MSSMSSFFPPQQSRAPCSHLSSPPCPLCPHAPGEEVAIAAAILDLFWRLPRSAVKFLESQPLPGSSTTAPLGGTHSAVGVVAVPSAAVAAAAGSGGPQQPGLVVLTIQLEEKLSRMPMAGSPQSRMLTSAYREPLLRFLAK